jgi:hypothetical protein
MHSFYYIVNYLQIGNRRYDENITVHSFGTNSECNYLDDMFARPALLDSFNTGREATQLLTAPRRAQIQTFHSVARSMASSLRL